MFLFGEICPTSGLCRYGSRTEGPFQKGWNYHRTYGAPGTACGGNTKRDWAEVSRGHSSFPAGRRGPNLVARRSRLGLRIGVEARSGQSGAGDEVHNQPWTFNGSWTRTQPMRLKGSERRIILVGYRCSLASLLGTARCGSACRGGVGAGAKHPRLPD
jgi:hypothetical protein